jgi:D-arabinose 1-dehydrogenase-like Zn-dependent alcohol dehydrogenase
MKSQVITAYGQPLEEMASVVPEMRGTEVLLAVRGCGVCHSDLHLHDGHFDIGRGRTLDVRSLRQLPFTLGHEIEGEVIALGPEASGVAIGERRAVYPWIGCGTCATCLSAEEHLCGKPRVIGINVNGGFSDHVLVPHSRYLLDCEGVPEGLAGTYMCSGLTAFGALRRVTPSAAKGKLLIIGLGGVGMMALQFARALYGSQPLVVDVDTRKLDFAVAQGAARGFNGAAPEAAKEILAATGGGVDAAIDFVGSEQSTKLAVSVVRKGGQVVIVGLFGGEFSMPIPFFPMRCLTICGSYVANLASAHEMMAIVRGGKIPPIPVERRPLSAAGQALVDLRAGRVLGRVVLNP